MSSENPYQSPAPSPSGNRDSRPLRDTRARTPGFLSLLVLGGLNGLAIGATMGAAALGILTPVFTAQSAAAREQSSQVAREVPFVLATTAGVILGGVGGAVAGSFLGAATGACRWLFGFPRLRAGRYVITAIWAFCGLVLGDFAAMSLHPDSGAGGFLWSCGGALVCGGAAAVAERWLSWSLDRFAGVPCVAAAALASIADEHDPASPPADRPPAGEPNP